MLGKHDVSRGKSFNLECLLVGFVRGGGGGGRGHLARSGRICFGLISSALVGAFCGSNDINNENQVQLSDSVGVFFVWWSVFFFLN